MEEIYKTCYEREERKKAKKNGKAKRRSQRRLKKRTENENEMKKHRAKVTTTMDNYETIAKREREREKKN